MHWNNSFIANNQKHRTFVGPDWSHAKRAACLLALVQGESRGKHLRRGSGAPLPRPAATMATSPTKLPAISPPSPVGVNATSAEFGEDEGESKGPPVTAERAAQLRALGIDPGASAPPPPPKITIIDRLRQKKQEAHDAMYHYGPPYHAECVRSTYQPAASKFAFSLCSNLSVRRYGGNLTEDCNDSKASAVDIHGLLNEGADPKIGDPNVRSCCLLLLGRSSVSR